MSKEELERLRQLAAAGDENAARLVAIEEQRLAALGVAQSADKARAAAEANAAETAKKLAEHEARIAAETQAREAAARAQLPEQEQLRLKLQEMEAAQARDRAHYNEQLAFQSQQSTNYYLGMHREQALRAATAGGQGLVLGMVVTGPTPEAINASIAEAQKEYLKIQAEARANWEREQLSKISASAVPQVPQNPHYVAPQAGFPTAAQGQPAAPQFMQPQGLTLPPGMSAEDAVRSGFINQQNKHLYAASAGLQPNYGGGGVQQAPASMNYGRPQLPGMQHPQSQPFHQAPPQQQYQQAPQWQPPPPPVAPQGFPQAFQPPPAPPPPQYQQGPQQSFQAPPQGYYPQPTNPTMHHGFAPGQNVNGYPQQQPFQPQVHNYQPQQQQQPEAFQPPPQGAGPVAQVQQQYDQASLQAAQEAAARARRGANGLMPGVQNLVQQNQQHMPGIQQMNPMEVYHNRFAPEMNLG